MKIETATFPPPQAIAIELFQFGFKQVMACLFGGALLLGMLLTRESTTVSGLPRNDFLFLYAVGLQFMLIALRLEHGKELVVIIAFHILATGMEWFKTSPEIGSWQYPGEGAIFRIYQVPLFAGFLYSAVGSYIARAWRLFEFRFENYPSVAWTIILAAVAYLNFFTHHYIFDMRWVLIGASFLIFGKTFIYIKNGDTHRRLPLLPGLFAVAFAIWIAENLGTYARAWAYPNQENGWQLVHFGKISAWYLLMLLSFVLVSLIQRKSLNRSDDANSLWMDPCKS